VIRCLPDQENRRDQDIGPLGDQLRLLDTAEEVSPNRRMQPVLLKRRYRDEHHVGSREQVPDLWPRHVGQIVFDLLLVPQRIGLSPDCAWQENRCQRDYCESSVH